MDFADFLTRQIPFSCTHSSVSFFCCFPLIQRAFSGRSSPLRTLPLFLEHPVSLLSLLQHQHAFLPSLCHANTVLSLPLEEVLWFCRKKIASLSHMGTGRVVIILAILMDNWSKVRNKTSYRALFPSSAKPLNRTSLGSDYLILFLLSLH